MLEGALEEEHSHCVELRVALLDVSQELRRVAALAALAAASSTAPGQVQAGAEVPLVGGRLLLLVRPAQELIPRTCIRNINNFKT